MQGLDFVGFCFLFLLVVLFYSETLLSFLIFCIYIL
jgi:hypothetical protein